jgi:hypothetical protein
MFGKHPNNLLQQGQYVYTWRMAGTRDVVRVTCNPNPYQKPSPQDDAADATVQDIRSGRSTHQGDLSVVAWRSAIPPYYTYFASCISRTVGCSTVNKKRPRHALV